MAAPAEGPAAFADDGKAVLERPVESGFVKHANIDAWYELDRTVDYIANGNYKKIALQFPDELLPESVEVADRIRQRTGQFVCILADTSYGSCCVDEVAAEHVGADLVVHYGHSCLSPTSRLPVLYVFGQQPMDLEDCTEKFEELFKDTSTPIVIMCNVEYERAVAQLATRLSQTYTRIIPTTTQSESSKPSTLPNSDVAHSCATDGTDSTCCGGKGSVTGNACCTTSLPAVLQADNLGELPAEKRQGGRYYDLPEGVSLEECSIFFVGHEGLTLTNIIMVHNKCPIYTYDPETRQARQETVSRNKMLMRRYFLVGKAKDAGTIGIVVGTLGVASYMNIIEHIKKVITASGRKWYLFVMGKLNVAKMANFMEIECYVLVACPENSLIDSKEFYRPIVTPFELEIALVRSKEWTGDYILDFSRLLPGLRTDGFEYDNEHDQGLSDEEPDFSFITGQYIYRPLLGKKTSDDTSQAITSGLTDLTLRNNETSITQILNSTAGEYLKNRTFRGLETNIGQDEAATVEEGRSGIAKGYKNGP